MPQPSEPPNRSPFLQRLTPSPEWAQWFMSIWSALNSRQFYIPTVSGAPTFTPETRTGFVAMVYDTTNDELYVFNGSWKSTTLT